jgi:hypothetical protein
VKYCAVSILILVLSASAAAADPLLDDVKARRARVAERLGAETVALFWSAPTGVLAGDVDEE